jgi:hypothetical protein
MTAESGGVVGGRAAVDAVLLGHVEFHAGNPSSLTREQAIEKANTLARAEMDKLNGSE